MRLENSYETRPRANISDDLHYTPQTKFAADLFCLVLKHAKITTFAVYFKGNSECFGQC